MAARNTPSGGSKPDKLIRDAIMLDLHREAENSNGANTKKINVIAAKLVEMAMNGDIQAIKEINDRVDGKPAQQLNHANADGDGPAEFLFKTIYERSDN